MTNSVTGSCLLLCISTAQTAAIASTGAWMISNTTLAQLAAQTTQAAVCGYGALGGFIGGLVASAVFCARTDEQPSTSGNLAYGMNTGLASAVIAPIPAAILQGGCTASVKYITASSFTGFATMGSIAAVAGAVIVVFQARQYYLAKNNGELEPLNVSSETAEPSPACLDKIYAALANLSNVVTCQPAPAAEMARSTPS
jgi:hypothetical protein